MDSANVPAICTERHQTTAHNAHINTNKADLSNKVLLYFSLPFKHRRPNLLVGVFALEVWITQKQNSPFFFLLYREIPLSFLTSGTPQKRAGCSIVEPPEFQFCLIVFSAGHLTPTPLTHQYCLPCLFFPSADSQRLGIGSRGLVVGVALLRDGCGEDKEVCHQFETRKASDSQGEGKCHRTIWSPQTIKLVLSLLTHSLVLSFILSK